MADIKDIISRLELARIKEFREAVIGLALVVAATFFFYQYIYVKNVVEIKRLDFQIQTIMAEMDKASAEIKETQKVAERLKEAMERLKGMEDRFVVTQSKLPSDKQLSSILKGLIGDDAKKGIKFTSLRPMSLETKGEYFKLPFQIAMQARFQSFGEYLERIEEMPRIVTVENFRIEAKEEAQPPIESLGGTPLLSIQLFMSTYVLGGQ